MMLWTSSGSGRTATLLILALVLLFFVAGCCFFPSTGRRGYEREERRMVVTAYDAGPESCGWKRKYGCIGPAVFASGPLKGRPKRVGITASGQRARKGTIAADPRYPFGTRIYVPGYGWGEVQDRGSAIRGDRLDVFFHNRNDALEWGRQTLNVIILKPR